MAPTVSLPDFSRISIDDRIALVQAIWDSIDRDSHGPLLSDEQRRELKRRVDDCRNNPEDVIPWEQIEAEARKRYQA